MIDHNRSENAAAAAAAAPAADQADGVGRDSEPAAEQLPPKRRKQDAHARYAAWSENQTAPVAVVDELALYLSEPIGDDSDLLAWWQVRVCMS